MECVWLLYVTNRSKYSIKYHHFYSVGQEFRQSRGGFCLLHNVWGLTLWIIEGLRWRRRLQASSRTCLLPARGWLTDWLQPGLSNRTCVWRLRTSWASPNLQTRLDGKHLESEHSPRPRQNHKSCTVPSAMLPLWQASQYDQPTLKGRGIRLHLLGGDVNVPLQKSMWHKRVCRDL